MEINKKRIVYILYGWFIITIISQPVLCSASKYHFKYYNINNGLSQNTVNCIFQDKQGFMWFGTKDGLNRFDGSSFKTFRFSPNSNLRDNVFKRIIQDSKDDLWVATEEGIYIYNPRIESFSRFEEKTDMQESINGIVSDMILDGEGDVWISVEEKGIFRYSVTMSKLFFYEIPLVSEGMKILSLCAGKNNDVWVFPYSSPFLNINKRTGKVVKFELQDNQSLLSDVGEISSVLADQYNELILATSHLGVLSINTINHTHSVLLDEDEYGKPIFARSLCRIDNKTLWIGTESGIFIYNTETKNVINLKHNNSVPYSLSDDAIYSIYKDKDEGIWIGTYFGGVNYYPNLRFGFEIFYSLDNSNSINGNRVREFCKSENGKIWIGTEDAGLNLFDPYTKMFIPIDKRLQALYTNIHALYNDDRYLWISTFSKGLNRYDLKTHELVTYTQYDIPKTVSQNSAFALCKDRQNMLWIGTLSGVDIYDYARNSFRHVKELEGTSIQDIKEDTDGNIWIATFNKGLYRFNPSTNKWSVFQNDPLNASSFPYNKTTSIFEDSKKRLWITTQGGGMGRFNKKDETFSTINTDNGLTNNVVYQILEDDEGYLWLSTNSGIILFNPEANSFRNYTIANGLRTNQFNYKSSYKTDDGFLYFGSVDGFVRFKPSDFKEANKLLPVVLTDFYINNFPVNVASENSPLKESIQFTENICLPLNKNSIGFKYAVLDFPGLNAKNIMYKLEGFDKEWIYSNDSRSISYTNLPSGKYRLLIGFENENGVEVNEIAKIINIQIQPPFWKTWWAYSIYLVIIVGGLFLIQKKSKKIQRHNMRIFQQEKERELYKSKIDFFTNVAHEIRTPLSLIKAPLGQVLQENSLPKQIKENLVIMDRNTDRLLNLTNQLLDFRKTESDLYALDLKVYNISKLVEETSSRFIPYARENQISLRLNLPKIDLFAQIDKEAFIKIISNLINNAIKYGETFVDVTIRMLDENPTNHVFEFVTENDGAIVPDQFKEEIFKSFVHIEKNQKKIINGTGIGLALAKSLTELLKGTITYTNENKRNLFRVVLPIGTLGNESMKMSSLHSSNYIEEKKNDKHSRLPVVLIVEDDVELIDFLTKCLEGYYSVIRALNGLIALNMLNDNVVSVVVSDVMMPEMDGFELTKTIKSNIETSHIPVVLLTAKTTNQSKITGYEMGADAYIEKPFSVDVLQARIAGLLQNRQNLQEAFIKNPLTGATTIALTKSDEDFIRRLNDVVHRNLPNSDFNVEEIANVFNMSRASFYRKIKGVLDLTPNEYIRVERLKKAALLLKDNNYKVNEICYMVGFNSPSYFSKCFHQQFGVLPKDFI